MVYTAAPIPPRHIPTPQSQGPELNPSQPIPKGPQDGGRPCDAQPGNPPRRTPRWLLPLSLLVGIVWWIVLLGLAAQTANPVTLNFQQIAQADAIVLARVVQPEAGQVDVLRWWLREEPVASPLVLGNLDDRLADPDQSYLIPLSVGADGTLMVTRARLPTAGRNAPPAAAYIYPASPDTIQRLESLLKQRLPR